MMIVVSIADGGKKKLECALALYMSASCRIYIYIYIRLNNIIYIISYIISDMYI